MANPHEKKVFIGVKDFTLHIDNAGYKYIQWTGENEYKPKIKTTNQNSKSGINIST